MISRVWIPDCPINHSDFFGFDLVSETLFLIEDFFLKFRFWIRHLIIRFWCLIWTILGRLPMNLLSTNENSTTRLLINSTIQYIEDWPRKLLVLVLASMLQEYVWTSRNIFSLRMWHHAWRPTMGNCMVCIGERKVFAQRPTTFDTKILTVWWCYFISHYRCNIEITWAVRVSRGVMLYRVTGIMPVYFGNDVINK